MSNALDQNLLAAILDSWNRNNIIMLNYERLVSVFEEAAEFARNVLEEEWMVEHDRASIAQMLEGQCRGGAGRSEREGVGRLGPRPQHDHPVLLLQLFLWHEGYHHGQIKLALKAAGHPISDKEAGPLTWDVWRPRKRAGE